MHEARLAADGLDLCASTRPDLIILDLGLPDLPGGYEFISRVREWSQVPIIVVSVARSGIQQSAGAGRGANDGRYKTFWHQRTDGQNSGGFA